MKVVAVGQKSCRCSTKDASPVVVGHLNLPNETDKGSPAKLVKQLSVMYPCGNGQLSEAGGVAARTVMLGQFTLSYGQFSFTNFAGEPR